MQSQIPPANGHDGQGAPPPTDRTAWKRMAARAAVAAVPAGAVLGLGSGSTAELMLEELTARIRQEGLRVVGVATSERTRQLAAGLGIPLAELDDVPQVDMSIDGADEIALPALDLVKGRGGALLREKLVAAASGFRVIIVDATKVVQTLATAHALPVEVETFGWQQTARRLVALGGQPQRRMIGPPDASDASDARPFISDGGHYVLDCAFAPLAEPGLLAAEIKAITGVVDHGLFIGMTDRAYIAGPEGLVSYDCPR
ncbi:MAG TPA: ribose-5-phosphate isomerase RpiA [Ktedonobacterales bacterium]